MTTCGNVTGATSDSLTLAALQTADTATYRVIVTNDVGTVVSARVKLSVLSSPTITKQPVSQLWYEQDTATFSVAAVGSPTLKYQWRKDSQNIPNATASTLKLTNMAATQAGTYSVVISNAVGSITSDDVILQIDPVPLLLNRARIIKNQALPTSAITSGFGDVGAVWVPALGAISGEKMHFDNLSIESRPSAR